MILMDLRMPEMDGVEAIGRSSRRAAARVLVLTTFDTDSDVLAAIEAGATGYLLKDAPTDRSCSARSARRRRGEAVLSPSVATRVVGQMRVARRAGAPPPEIGHQPRELEVLEFVARGASNRDAAPRLFISEATVKTHLMHIYAKLGVNDRAAAVAEAFDRGLLIPRHRAPGRRLAKATVSGNHAGVHRPGRALGPLRPGGPAAPERPIALVLRCSGRPPAAATLSQQSFWLDEAYTQRLVRMSFGSLLRGVPNTESTPPVLRRRLGLDAHVQLSEFGLRSLSALAGIVTVPVVYLAAAGWPATARRSSPGCWARSRR